MIKLLFMTLGSPSGEEAIDSTPEVLNIVSNSMVNTSPTSLGVVAGIGIGIFAVAATYGAPSSSIPDQTEKIVELLPNSATSGLNVENFLTSPLPPLKQIGELSTNIPNLPGMSPFPLTRSDSGIGGFPSWVPPSPVESLPQGSITDGFNVLQSVAPVLMGGPLTGINMDSIPSATHVSLTGVMLAMTLGPLFSFYENKHHVPPSFDIKSKIQSIVEHLLFLGSCVREAPGSESNMEQLSSDYFEELQQLLKPDNDDEFEEVLQKSLGPVNFYEKAGEPFHSEADGVHGSGKRTFNDISK